MTPKETMAAFVRLKVLMENVGYRKEDEKQLDDKRKGELLQFDHADRTELVNHLFYMCSEGRRLVIEAIEENERGNFAHEKKCTEKAHRWLGFVQGVLVAGGIVSIEQMKALNAGNDGIPD